jgi:excisionase family DNA binding protein
MVKSNQKASALADKLAFSIPEAAEISSLGPTSLYQAIKEKRLIRRKFGTRTVIRRADLEAFLEGLPGEVRDG